MKKLVQAKLSDDDMSEDENIIKDVVPLGKIKCYISGKLRKETPEEYVRQEVARSLVNEYGYTKENMEVEFKITMGRANKKADIVVFKENSEHTQENIYLIAEVKKETIRPSDKENGIEQLNSYIAASMNCKYALWVGSERLSYIVNEKNGTR